MYVIPCGKGYTCLGFDVCIERANGIAKWMGVDGVQHIQRGHIDAYHRYQYLCELGAFHAKETGTRCPIQLTPQLIGLEGKRVEVVEEDGETRRFIVGKSTGWMPCHLEIETRQSSGGFAVTGAPFKSVRVISGGR